MDAELYLSQVEKLDQLIDGTKAEWKQLKDKRDLLRAIAEDSSSKLPDGMPRSFTGTTTKKVENAVVGMVMLDGEIKKIEDVIARYIEAKNVIVKAIEKLPAKEYGVLHRYYIRYMTYEEIAEDMGISTVQVWRIKKKALENLSNVIVCNT